MQDPKAAPTPAERLRARLDDLGWTQSDLSEALDVTPGVVCRWLSGERTPSLEMAFRIQDSRIGLPASMWIHAQRGAGRAKTG